MPSRVESPHRSAPLGLWVESARKRGPVTGQSPVTGSLLGCALRVESPAVRSGAGLRVGAGRAGVGRVRGVAGGAGLWVADGRSLAGSSIEMYVRKVGL